MHPASGGEPGTPSLPDIKAQFPPPRRVRIVTDHDLTRRLFCDAMEASGYIVADDTPDFILTDDPDFDGGAVPVMR